MVKNRVFALSVALTSLLSVAILSSAMPIRANGLYSSLQTVQQFYHTSSTADLAFISTVALALGACIRQVPSVEATRNTLRMEKENVIKILKAIPSNSSQKIGLENRLKYLNDELLIPYPFVDPFIALKGFLIG